MRLRGWLVFGTALACAGCGEKQDPVGGDGGVDGEVTYSDLVKPILDANCTGCHASDRQGAQRNGAPTGVDLDIYEAAVESADRSNQQIQPGSMPPAGPLSDEDKAIFQAWLDQGLLE